MLKSGRLCLFLLLVACLAWGTPLWGQQTTVPELRPEQLQEMLSQGADFLLINTMSPIECRDHAIPKSVCIPCEAFGGHIGELPDDKGKKLVYYCESDLCLRSYKSAGKAKELGYRRVYVLKGGLPGWKQAGFRTVAQERIPRRAVPSVKAAMLKKWLADKEPVYLLDISSEDAFRQAHIDGAVNIPFYLLDQRYHELPSDRKIVLVDERGFRSFLAACYLARKGYQTTRLFGGMDSWEKMLKNEKRAPTGKGK
ncbi:MAG TPA: rhodanese-like domain-containing protein [Syntrophales bacterium]|nr:rhodanese-like domain-containing protein [Syntrophales bacterium]HON22549.1 rhodanese-like domain-containing protein [Syntrophales bacterium]HOU77141.1 rhodanese-like domain-containing protein [Syntrophales bacterium]HQG33669.1 rhodanese-like domain-containing protein [Syntrophales bacterium]HQI36099.1 rhodanese-like domain-containing protein [Syntrophales bacterium]